MTPRIKSIGSTAYSLLTSERIWSIWGSTSQGCYIGNTDGQILFITDDLYRGPLTINLSGNFKFFNDADIGAPVQGDPSTITIPSLRMVTPLNDAVIWESPQTNGIITNPAEINVRSMRIVVSIIQNKPGLDKDSLLNQLADHRPSTRLPDDASAQPEKLWRSFSRIRQAIARSQPDDLLTELNPLIGFGRGLTPSGDDFILGLLLCLNRWHFPGWDMDNLGRLNSGLILAARQKTTAISACLIECAAAGQADERLIGGLDYLFLAHDGEMAAINGIINWGSSSGTDALAGMVACIQALTF